MGVLYSGWNAFGRRVVTEAKVNQYLIELDGELTNELFTAPSSRPAALHFSLQCIRDTPRRFWMCM